jgi:hypothetical protein
VFPLFATVRRLFPLKQHRPEAIGSQLLPLNVWINPVYWPFAILETPWAADISVGIALGVFTAACYAPVRGKIWLDSRNENLPKK